MHKPFGGYLFCCVLWLASIAAAQDCPSDELAKVICELRSWPSRSSELNLRAEELIGKVAQQGTAANHAVPHLFAAFDIEYENARREAAEALGNVCADPIKLFPPLIITAYEGPRSCRFSTPYSLMDSAGRKLQDNVLVELLKDSDWRVRCWAVRQLRGRIIDRERTAANENRKQFSVSGRAAVSRELEAQRLEEVVTCAASHLTCELVRCIQDEDPDVRAFAADALAQSWSLRLNALEHLIPLFNDEEKLRYNSPFGAGIQSPGMTVREVAILAACHLRQQMAPADPLYATSSDRNWYVREGTLRALFARSENSERWRTVLISTLRDPDDRLFIIALTNSHSRFLNSEKTWKFLVPALIESLENETRIVQAATRLGEIGAAADGALPKLDAIAAHADEPNNWRAKAAAERIRNSKATVNVVK